MRCAIVFGILCVLLCSVVAKPNEHEEDHENAHDASEHKCDFKEYMKKWGKHYDSQEEQDKAEAAYTEHCKKTEQHNSATQTRAAGAGFKMGDNEFSAIPHPEFMKKFTGLKKVKRNNQTRAFGFRCVVNPPIPNMQIPASYDARQLGLVNPPEHQGECGDCYAFSATGAMEAAYRKIRNGGPLPNFSEQHIASCSMNRPGIPGFNNGCHGGDQTVVFEFVNEKGIAFDSEYPYTSKDGNLARCNPNAPARAKVGECGQNQGRLSVQDIQKLLLRYGTLAASMDANGRGFQGYRGGIYRGDNCGKRLEDTNHAVLFVGWGSQNGQDYWIVKNSWGTNWGEGGYFRIARGVNECAMEVDVSYVSKI